jgi:hypothetical protein
LYRVRAREVSERAEGGSAELRDVLMAVGAAYEIMARVQDTLDDEDAVYQPPPENVTTN